MAKVVSIAEGARPRLPARGNIASTAIDEGDGVVSMDAGDSEGADEQEGRQKTDGGVHDRLLGLKRRGMVKILRKGRPLLYVEHSVLWSIYGQKKLLASLGIISRSVDLPLFLIRE